MYKLCKVYSWNGFIHLKIFIHIISFEIKKKEYLNKYIHIYLHDKLSKYF